SGGEPRELEVILDDRLEAGRGSPHLGFVAGEIDRRDQQARRHVVAAVYAVAGVDGERGVATWRDLRDRARRVELAIEERGRRAVRECRTRDKHGGRGQDGSREWSSESHVAVLRGLPLPGDVTARVPAA